MGNPNCPFCENKLKIIKYTVYHIYIMFGLKVSRGSINDYWVCLGCKKHWLRSASIMRVTAKKGIKPKVVIK